MDDGGTAFPAEEWIQSDDPRCVNPIRHMGMSLRDYFAIHSVQPGAGEICAAAGVVYRNGGVWSDEQTRISGFDDWFGSLPLDERLRLFAAVKYAMADAMLRARKT